MLGFVELLQPVKRIGPQIPYGLHLLRGGEFEQHFVADFPHRGVLPQDAQHLRTFANRIEAELGLGILNCCFGLFCKAQFGVRRCEEIVPTLRGDAIRQHRIAAQTQDRLPFSLAIQEAIQPQERPHSRLPIPLLRGGPQRRFGVVRVAGTVRDGHQQIPDLRRMRIGRRSLHRTQKASCKARFRQKRCRERLLALDGFRWHVCGFLLCIRLQGEQRVGDRQQPRGLFGLRVRLHH